MKKYLVNNDKEFITGYDIKNEQFIVLNYADGSQQYLPYSKEKVQSFDKVMERQFERYNYDPVVSVSFKNFAFSLGTGSLGGLFIGITQEGNLYDTIVVSTGLGACAFSIVALALGACNAQNARNDYLKDELMLSNKELLENSIKDDEFYGKLSKGLREKVTDIHTGNQNLCLNAVNDFSLREMEKLVWKSEDFESKKLVRK